MKPKRLLLSSVWVGISVGICGCALWGTASPSVATMNATPTPPIMITNNRYCESLTERCGDTTAPPPLCSIIPLQTSLTETQQLFGNEGEYYEQNFTIHGISTEGIWLPYTSSVGIDYDAQKHVVGVAYRACVTLGEMVNTYGAPEWLYVDVACLEDCNTPPPFDFVDFVWIEHGIWAHAASIKGLYTTPDGHLLPFSTGFYLTHITYYAPFTLEAPEPNPKISSRIRLEWPGFAENDAEK